MIRIVLFLIVVGALSLGVVWLADRPGDVVIVWQGLRIKTSVMVLGAAPARGARGAASDLEPAPPILRSPGLLSRHLQHRRGVRAYEAISNGLIAVGSGDIAAAQKHAAAVNRLAPHEPLALLLNAQSAQLSGDREGAERTFRAMAGRADTKPLGLHGLFVEAHRRNDHGERAGFCRGSRAHRAVARLGQPRGARGALQGRRLGRRAGFARSQCAHARQGRLSPPARGAAHRPCATPSRTPIATAPRRWRSKRRSSRRPLCRRLRSPARLLAEGGQLRKAPRIIDKAWRANPHPELAQAYSELRSGESARDRLKRIEALAAKVPGHVEGALAIARAALNAQEFAKARAALAPYLAAPTKRIALLMAELERAERNDVGRAREWLARAVHAAPDPAWTADGHVSDRWLPASPVTGRLDALEWRVPVTGVVKRAGDRAGAADAGARGNLCCRRRRKPLTRRTPKFFQIAAATSPRPSRSAKVEAKPD